MLSLSLSLSLSHAMWTMLAGSGACKRLASIKGWSKRGSRGYFPYFRSWSERSPLTTMQFRGARVQPAFSNRPICCDSLDASAEKSAVTPSPIEEGPCPAVRVHVAVSQTLAASCTWNSASIRANGSPSPSRSALAMVFQTETFAAPSALSYYSTLPRFDARPEQCTR